MDQLMPCFRCESRDSNQRKRHRQYSADIGHVEVLEGKTSRSQETGTILTFIYWW